MNKKDNLIICFEGIEGCGKSTQVYLLSLCLFKSGIENVMLREPGSTKLGEELRDLIFKNLTIIDNITNILLYSAARRENIIKNINKNIKNKIILLDRYLLSTLVYQGHGNQELLDKINLLHREINFNLFPDITFLLQLDPEISIKRIQSRENNNYLDNQPIIFHKNISQLYNKYKEFYFSPVTIINANQQIYDIHNNIIKVLNNKFDIKLNSLSKLEIIDNLKER